MTEIKLKFPAPYRIVQATRNEPCCKIHADMFQKAADEGGITSKIKQNPVEDVDCRQCVRESLTQKNRE